MEKIPPKNNVKSVGIIMDGNRRWAKAHHMPALEGHRQGYKRLKELGDWAEGMGVTHVTVYAFSSENWKRTTDEVGYLMELLRWMLEKELSEFHEKGRRLRFIGDL